VTLGEKPLDTLLRLEREIRASSPQLPEESEAPALWSGLSFRVGDRRLVVQLDDIGEVVTPVTVTPVPLTRPWLQGVANVRGELLTIVDLAQFFGMQPVQPDDRARLLIVNDPLLRSAVLVAEVTGMRHFSEEHGSATAAPQGPMTPYLKEGFERDGVRYDWLDLIGLARSDAYLHGAAA